MPNIVRRPRPRQPERRHNRACAPGTHLTDEERCHIYRLSQHQGYSQRVIATTLQLPRTTVQSAIHAMAGRCKKQQHRTQKLIMPVSEIAPAIASSHNTAYQIKEGDQAHAISQLPHLLHLTGTKPPVPTIATLVADDRRGQPSQPTTVAHHRDSHDRNNALMEFPNLQRFSAHQDAFEASSPPFPPKLPPVEPRAIYESF
ncbi:hypothetical protein DM02DRAFT_663991 [Periconia macrospinosa]|uniref:Uncharacterized protein n=1 Tax=Periconia macrospinosa TaxID=97972 RepID=A0A2V1D0A8_9PLEO|nr:hypothetical protein DM02DRAFT_663991 [Periconia macrospinosa]